MDYSVNLTDAGTYTMNFRVATMVAGAQFQVRNSGGTVLATVSVPSTGTYQTWQTISAQVTLPAGQQTIRIFTTASPAGWNLNWLEFVSGAASKTVSTQATAESATAAVTNLSVYPNPVQDRFMLQVNNDQTGAMKVQLVNMNGSVQKQFSLNKANKGATQTYLSIGDLPKGSYVIVVSVGEWSESVQLIKL
jgi:endoglucanase